MASRSLGTLTLDLVVKTGAFVAGMSQAERAADSKLRGIEKRAGDFGKKFGAALGVGISAALASGIAAIDSAIDRMEVDVYVASEDPSEGIALVTEGARVLRDALEPVAGILQWLGATRESATKLYRYSFVVKFVTAR